MADPVTNAVNQASGSLRSAFSKAKSFGWTALKWGGLGVGLAVVGPAFAMQPDLLATVASNLGTQEAATTLTASVGQSLGNAATYFGTGIANSGPVWDAYGSAMSSGWEGITNFASNVDFTPMD